MVRKRTLPNFEKALAELERLVERMEEGQLTLEESVQTFERGIQLSRSCQQALEQAEQRIQTLAEGTADDEHQGLERPDQAQPAAGESGAEWASGSTPETSGRDE